MGLKKFPFYRQMDAADCGPTCLRMISRYHGQSYSLPYLREKSFLTRDGVSFLGLSEAAEKIGFRTLAAKIPFAKLQKEAPLPFIAHWRQRHFVVVYGFQKDRVKVADPSHGLVTLSKKEFLDGWIGHQDENVNGIALLLEPTPDFHRKEETPRQRSAGFGLLITYFSPYKKLIWQLALGLLIGSLLQLIFPFLTQSIVDIGINNHDLSFITLILIAQLMLFLSGLSVSFIRSWILLHLGAKMNISILSDFLTRLMRLPVSFFDSKNTGDLLQRIGDHQRVEDFLTSNTLTTIFSIFNLLVFGLVLAVYQLKIFLIFFVGSTLYIVWILLFLRKRKEIDYKRFDQLSSNQNKLIQLITGITEIKLNNSEKQKRWEWERIQARLFNIRTRGLELGQYQVAGSSFFNELKNILITFTAAYSVVTGELTLGMMLAIQYIIGQMNGPLIELAAFIHMAQDAKMSLERLDEIHVQAEEEDQGKPIRLLPVSKSITVRNLTFQYEGPRSVKVLADLTLEIPENKVTAIVGPSGSGKTTLLKLLLKFYEPSEGEIKLGETNLSGISSKEWRSLCGAVLQEGFIFADTILGNIAVGEDHYDEVKLLHAVTTANIGEFVESLPLGFHTRIGPEGLGLSQGQKQRILIARAVYKDPQFLFFDEATNALDANNEKIIIENLNCFFKNKTVVVVAHRLSTVKNADQIIVLDKGRIVETGNHTSLSKKRGDYYHLVKNQLELG